MRRHGGRAALALLLATAGSVAAFTAVPVRAAPSVGTVTGRVVGPTDLPAAGATVAAYTDLLAAPVGTSRTDASGGYALHDLPGDTLVEICVDPSTAHNPPATGWVASCAWTADPDGFYVGAGSVVDGVDVTLARGGALTGRVTANPGTPLAGVVVTATGYDLDIDPATARRSIALATAARTLRPTAAGAAGIDVAQATTAADGTYRLSGLPSSDDWQLCFDGSAATGGYWGSYQPQCVNRAVVADASTAGVDAVLARAGTASGHVFGPGGAGLAGATVTFGTAAGRQIATATTDALGNFRRSGLTGNLAVCVRPSAGQPAPGLLGTCLPGLSAFAPGRTTTVRATVATPGGAVLVQVSTLTGSPVTGVPVRLTEGPTAPTAVTDTGGVVRFTGLLPGRYVPCVGASDDRSVPWLPTCSGAVAVAGGTSQEVWITTRRGGTATGVVRDTAGQPVIGAVMRVLGIGSPDLRNVRSDGAGRYSVTGLPSGSFEVCAFPAAASATQAAPFACTDAEAVRGDTVEVPDLVVSAAGVEGTVTVAGQPLAHATITVDQPLTGTAYLQAYTDATGHYALTGLAPSGASTVCATPPPSTTVHGPPRTCVGSGRVLRAGTVVPVNLDLPARSAAISGRVTAEPSGAAAPDVEVTVDGVDVGSTDADGRYTIGGLAPGRVTLCLLAAGPRRVALLQSECWQNQSTSEPPADLTPVRLVAGRVTGGLDAQLTQLGTVTGRVTTDSGADAVGAVVTLYDKIAHFTVRTVTVGANGRFTIEGVGPNEYRLCVTAGPPQTTVPGSFQTRCSGGTAQPTTAARFTVGYASTVVQDYVLPAGAGVDGRVVDAAGDPVAGAQVAISPRPAVATAADGTFAVVGLPVKNLTACVTAPGHATTCTALPAVQAGAVRTVELTAAA